MSISLNQNRQSHTAEKTNIYMYAVYWSQSSQLVNWQKKMIWHVRDEINQKQKEWDEADGMNHGLNSINNMNPFECSDLWLVTSTVLF